MFKPAKMHHATVVIGEDKVQKLIDALYEAGVCELKQSKIDLDSKYHTEDMKSADNIRARLNYILDNIEDYQPVVQPENRIKELFVAKKPQYIEINLRSNQDIIRDIEKRLKDIEPKVIELLNKLQESKEKIQNNEFVISNLSLFPQLKTNLFRSSDNLSVIAGRILNPSLDLVKRQLAHKTVFGIEEIDDTESFIMVISLPENKSQAERMLHDIGVQILEVPFEDKTPSQLIDKLKKENDKFNAEIKRVEGSLKRLYKQNKQGLAILEEEMAVVLGKIGALHNFKTSKAFSVVEAWVPNKDFKRFLEIVENTSKGYYLEVDEKNDAPTLYDNKPYIKPFEAINNLYSPPKYNYFDPTSILAVTFAIFFGLMLTDAIYGLLLLALGYGLYRGAGRYNDAIKSASIILLCFGSTTLIWGIIYGSYFGDFFNTIGIKIPYLIDSLRDVIVSLSIALGIGTLHVCLGLLIGFMENLNKEGFKKALAAQGVWLIFMVSVLFLILSSFIPLLATIGYIILAAAVLINMYFGYLDGGPMTALLSVFGFSGFLGDLFSYARLMALGVGTAGIALAVNFLTVLTYDMVPYVGIVFAVIVFIIGHLFNLLMNGLGAFIHSTRLHFLEFFQKFYEGGGRLYRPFKSARELTNIKQL